VRVVICEGHVLAQRIFALGREWRRSKLVQCIRAEHDGKFFLIHDESTLADLLSGEDAEGVEFVKVLEFDSEEERAKYVAATHWK
jgi:hypothetical protein